MVQTPSSWRTPRQRLSVRANDVHLWRQALNISSSCVARFFELLSADEVLRANAFYREIDRNRFIVARGCLRIILSRYVMDDPDKIQFGYSEYGKPFIVAPHLPSGLCFNLAHSGDLALYAVTLAREVGVDLEMLRPDFPGFEIAERFFSSNEIAHLRSLTGDEQNREFFNCWTRKEAFLKGKGLGLSRSLSEFDVTEDLDEPADLLETRWDYEEVAGWSLRSIEIGVNCVAAVAVMGYDWKLSFWQIDEWEASSGK